MQYPKLSSEREETAVLRAFGGLDRRERIAAGAFADMQNLSSRHYPVLSTRGARGRYPTAGGVTGLLDKNGLCYMQGGDFVIGDYRVPLGLTPSGRKTLVSMGAYVIVMPDKKYVNTADLSDFGAIEARVSTAEAVSFMPCTAEGEALGEITVGAAVPEAPESGALWLDTSAKPHTLKQYSAESGLWTALASTYVCISSPGIGAPFARDDGVRIQGVTAPLLADLNASAVVCARGEDFIVVRGLIGEYTVQTEPVTVERRMPVMDFLIESGNRLWGCRYGTDGDGRVVNEIYASALGDFRNWERFEGISTDAYAVSVGTDGAFTGAITYLGYPIFFKEDHMHKIYGNSPDGFCVQTTACRGVRRGCGESLAVAGEILYYVSRGCVCAYDGSLPTEVSAPLGTLACDGASAGAVDARYYLSLSGEKNELLVYDTARSLWHREDETRALAFCRSLGELYFLDEDGEIRTVGGRGERDTAPVCWYAETGRFGMDTHDRKRVTRLMLSVWLAFGSRLSIAIEYDSSGEWKRLFDVRGGKLASFTVPIRPARCDHFRLRLEGVGEAKLYSIAQALVKGGA